MELKQIKCPACGANVEVDEFSKSFTCNYCNAVTIIEKKYDDYTEKANEENYIKAESFIKDFKDYKNAKNQFESVIRRSPNDPRAIWGIIRCFTKDFNEKLYIDIQDYGAEWMEQLEKQINEKYQIYLNIEKIESRKKEHQELFENYIKTNKEEYAAIIDNNKLNNNEDSLVINQEKEDNKIIDNDNKKDFKFLIPIVVFIVMVIIVVLIIK